MKIKSANQKTYFLYILFFIFIIISCNNQRSANEENDSAPNQDNTKHIDKHTNSLALKYKSGVRSILEDSKGNIWFGSYNEGVCLLQNGKFTYFTTKNGLSDNQVRNIYEDKKGLIWFECGRGLSIFDGNKIIIYKQRNYNSKKKWQLNETDLWFKGDKTEGYTTLEKYPGVYQYDGKKLSYHVFPVVTTPEDGFKYYISTPFVKGKNRMVWFGAYGAVIGYNGSAFKIVDNESLQLNSKTGFLHVRSIFEDQNGHLWIGNNGIGVLKYDGKKVINFTEEHKLGKKYTKGNSLEKVFSISEDSAGNVWFGTVGSGVWKYDGKSIINFDKKDGILSQHIWTIYKSKKGELWFGGANPSGVYRFNGNSFERKY